MAYKYTLSTRFDKIIHFLYLTNLGFLNPRNYFSTKENNDTAIVFELEKIVSFEN